MGAQRRGPHNQAGEKRDFLEESPSEMSSALAQVLCNALSSFLLTTLHEAESN